MFSSQLRPRFWIVLCAALSTATIAYASDPVTEPSPATIEMLKSMRERGILTEEAYEDAYRREVEYQNAKHAEEELPGWLQDWTVGGDMRLRWDRQDWGDELGPGRLYVLGDDNINLDRPLGSAGFGQGERERFLLRLRLGAEKRLGEQLTFGFRVATGAPTSFGSNIGFNGSQTTYSRTIDNNPRSENVTLGDYFSGKSISFERAYVRWAPSFAPAARLTAGKFANPFSSGLNLAENLMWDPDIDPEGIGLEYRFDFMPETLWFDASAGYFLLNEVPGVSLEVQPAGSVTIAPNYDEKDPYMWGLQGGITGRPVEWITANLRASYYDLRDLNTEFVAYANDLGNGGDVLDDNPLLVFLTPGNALFNNGASRGSLDEIVVDGYLDFTPFGERFRVKPFFSWSEVLTAESEENAYGVGVELGDIDFLKLSVLYGEVERNGTVGIFTDSEIFDGFTNAKGWYVTAERRLTKYLRVRGTFAQSKINEEQCVIAQFGTPELCDTAFALFPDRLDEYRKTQRDRTRWQIDFVVDF